MVAGGQTEGADGGKWREVDGEGICGPSCWPLTGLPVRRQCPVARHGRLEKPQVQLLELATLYTADCAFLSLDVGHVQFSGLVQYLHDLATDTAMHIQRSLSGGKLKTSTSATSRLGS
jgi:hypothetical protein